MIGAGAWSSLGAVVRGLVGALFRRRLKLGRPTALRASPNEPTAQLLWEPSSEAPEILLTLDCDACRGSGRRTLRIPGGPR